MGKGYKGVPCVYCQECEADTADHVIARGFFPPDKRGDLPKAPACSECNNAKSKLEHTLTAIMPFGAQHGDAATVLEMVEPRLAKNKKLHGWLAAGVSYAMRSINGGPWRTEMSVPMITATSRSCVSSWSRASPITIGRSHSAQTTS